MIRVTVDVCIHARQHSAKETAKLNRDIEHIVCTYVNTNFPQSNWFVNALTPKPDQPVRLDYQKPRSPKIFREHLTYSKSSAVKTPRRDTSIANHFKRMYGPNIVTVSLPREGWTAYCGLSQYIYRFIPKTRLAACLKKGWSIVKDDVPARLQKYAEFASHFGVHKPFQPLASEWGRYPDSPLRRYNPALRLCKSCAHRARHPAICRKCSVEHHDKYKHINLPIPI